MMRRYYRTVSSFISLVLISLLLQAVSEIVAFHPSPSVVRCNNAYFVQQYHVSKSITAFTAEEFQQRESHRYQSVHHRTSSAIALESSSSSNQSGGGVESLSLDIIGDNHEQVGDEIAASVQAMLDTEWMPQTIHYKMGQSVKRSYIKVRQSSSMAKNESDDMIMTIMTTVADDLIENWKEYNKDTFVNAWDIANYVSDYLTTKINGDGCGCSSKIY